MGSINNIISSIFPSTAYSKSSSSGSSASSGHGSGVYGDAFEIKLTHTVKSDGSEIDTVDFAAYSGQNDGSFATAAAHASGSDFKSAFEQILDSLGDKDASTDSASTASADTAGSQQDGFGELSSLFNNLASGFDDSNSSGTVSVAKGGLLSEVGAPFHHHGFGSTTLDKITEDFMDEIIQSLQDNLNQSAGNIITTTSDTKTASA